MLRFQRVASKKDTKKDANRNSTSARNCWIRQISPIRQKKLGPSSRVLSTLPSQIFSVLSVLFVLFNNINILYISYYSM
jgi:hypothetical protein